MNFKTAIGFWLFTLALLAGVVGAGNNTGLEGATAIADLTISTLNSEFKSPQSTYEWLGQGDFYWVLENTGKTALNGLDASIVFPKDAQATDTKVWAYAPHPFTNSNCTESTIIHLNSSKSIVTTCKPFLEQNYYWDWTSPAVALKTEKIAAASKLTLSAVNIESSSVTKFKTHVTVPIRSSGEFNLTAVDSKTGTGTLLDPYWDSSWTYRAHLNVSNNLPYSVWGNYTVHIALNHSALLTAGKCNLTNGSDLRIVYDNGITAIELDRWSNDTWNNATAPTNIWFQLQANLTAWQNNTANYYLYCNNSAAGNPPMNLSKVFLFGDDFIGADGSSPDTTIWNVTAGTGNIAIIDNMLRVTTTAAGITTYIRTLPAFVSDKNATIQWRWYSFNRTGTYSASMGLNRNGFTNPFDSTMNLPRTSDCDLITGNGNADNIWTTGLSTFVTGSRYFNYEAYLSASNTTSILYKFYPITMATPLDSTCKGTGLLSGSATQATNCIADLTVNGGTSRTNYILAGAYQNAYSSFDWIYYRLFESAEPTVLLNDTAIITPPFTLLTGNNNSLILTYTNFYALWSDISAGMSGYIFSYDNGVGSFTNESWTAFGASNWSNVTKLLPSSVGAVVRYKWYANDTLNSWAETPVFTLTVLAGTGLLVTAADEQTGASLMFNVTFTNATTSQTYLNQTILSLLANTTGLPQGSVTATISSANISAGTSYVARKYIISISPSTSLNITAYLLSAASGIYFSFVIMDYNNLPIPNALVTASRFITSAYMPVEQGLTDTAGTANFFLDYSITYQVKVEAAGYITQIYSLSPSPSQRVSYVRLQGIGGSAPLLNISTILQNITAAILPDGYIQNNTFTINFIISSSSGDLQSYGMAVTFYNSTVNRTLLTNTTLTAPSGATFVYVTPNYSGFYEVQTWFLRNGFDGYVFTPKTYFVAAPTGFSGINPSILGWSEVVLQAVALLITIFIMVFFSRFGALAGATVGLCVLGIFTFGLGFIPVYWFILTLLAFMAVVFLRNRI